jgi:hypothetical protein
LEDKSIQSHLAQSRALATDGRVSPRQDSTNVHSLKNRSDEREREDRTSFKSIDRLDNQKNRTRRTTTTNSEREESKRPYIVQEDKKDEKKI